MEYPAVDKYRGMLRAYERLKRISTNNGNAISNTESRDTTEDFFNQCYHLKDWLKNDKTLSIKKDVEAFVTKSTALSLAADYCNSFKHGGLDRNSRSGKDLEKINTHINFNLTTRGFIASSQLEITISGEKYDSLKLAEKCIKDWDKFLKISKIVFPEP